MKGILKVPLILTAVVVVLRVILERADAPHMLAASLSVAWLHTLLLPLYFAIRLGASDIPQPYLALFKLVGIYVLVARAMIIPTYWLARIYGWREPRFEGLLPEQSNNVVGFVAIPFITAAVWIVASIVIGNLVGAIAIAITRSLTGSRDQRENPQQQ